MFLLPAPGVGGGKEDGGEGWKARSSRGEHG